MLPIAPDAASLPRRSLAGAVDAALAMTAMGTAAAVVARCAPAGARTEAIETTTQRLFGDRRVRLALQLSDPIRRVGMRATRSPGCRLAGIRRVDAADGGPPSLRAAIIESTLLTLLQQSIRVLTGPRRRRMQARFEETRARMRSLNDALADDPERREREVAVLARANGRTCLRAMSVPLTIELARPLSALRSPRRQTVIERVAGVAVVRERPGRATGRPRRRPSGAVATMQNLAA